MSDQLLADALKFALAFVSAGGLAYTARCVTFVIKKVRAGVPVKGNKRRIDIVQQRDDADARELAERTRADREAARADSEAAKRRRLEEHCSRLNRLLIEHGIEPPAWPDLTAKEPA